MNKKNIIITLLLTMIFFLVLLTNNYQQNQKYLVEESNHLYSPNNFVLQKISFNDIAKDKILNSQPYRLFYTVENNLNLDIRAYYSNNYKKWAPPLKDGEFFRKNNEKKAVVGNNVKVEYKNGKEYFKLENTKYEVIGRLGKKIPNRFKHSVLLSDSSFFNEEKKTYIIDGNNLKNMEKSKLTGEEYKNLTGVNRFLSVDYFSPMIILFSKILILGVLIFLVYCYHLYCYREILVLKIIGISNKKILWGKLCLLNQLFLITLLVVYCLYSQSTLTKGNFSYWLENFIYLLMMNLLYIIIYFRDRYEVTNE
ncbi:hypothetical protein [Candidatus Enterococcus mansonii]|uniref:Signal peptidase I n=2 Tax=Candidatus Enterococcus mansonii TaxID=1834181 RepID=A0ABU8IH38_9ENTE